ncbi:hypothetical protein [Leuconostoc lactis]|uniref:hypothetical protein n=1 Tax=Leuconostoc lactis TaxID=1246 RepID=UPI00241EF8E2|nr:hypothetical protein [Leuconostoc lactis]
METGKITITFKDDDTHDIEFEKVTGLEVIIAANTIIKQIVDDSHLSVLSVLGIIQSNIGDGD